MTRPATRPAAALALAVALAALAGCAGDDPDAAEVTPDSLLAEALVTLHLADARGALPGENADSLRAAAYAAARRATGLDSAAVTARLDAAALYRLVADRLEALEEGEW